MTEFVLTKNYDDMSRRAAGIIAKQIMLKTDTVLGLATGSSPLGIYLYLTDKYKKGEIDFSHITCVNLDEYKGLTRENECSYYRYMYNNFFSRVNIDVNKTFIPDGGIADADEACEKYEEILAAVGGIDLQLLGLGHNGHIGFNEPSDVFSGGAHCVDLTKSTMRANARFFSSEKDVPAQAYTMGIRNIMDAEKILLVVSGADKAAIVKKAFFGDITPRVPASVLQLHHNVTVVGDSASLAEIADMI